MLNPLSLSVPSKPQAETRTFTDPRQPGVEFTITLRASSGLLYDMGTDDLANDYIRRYSVGMPDGVQVSGAGRVKVGPSLCAVIAELERAQVPDPEEPPYIFEEWLTLIHRAPDAFAQIVLFKEELFRQEKARYAPVEEKEKPKEGTAEGLEHMIAGAPPAFPTPAGGD